MRLHAYIVIFVFAFFSKARAECYYPDGKIASGLVPCNPSGAVTHCCREADVCLSNGLCFSSGLGTIVRRGCTDSKWNNTGCPSLCTAGVEGKLSSGDAVFTPCGEYNEFCCGQNSDARACCDSKNNTVSIGGGDALCNRTVTLTASDPTKTNTITGLAVALGVMGLAFAVLAWDWHRKWEQLKVPLAMQVPLAMLNK